MQWGGERGRRLEWGLEYNNTCRKGVTHRYVVRGLRLAGTDDSPSSEQSTMIKIPSCSHWHGVGQGGAADTCPSRLRPYPQICPAVQRSRSSSSMSDTCPPVCLCLSCLLQRQSCVGEQELLSWFSVFLFAAFCPVHAVHAANLSQALVLSLHLSWLPLSVTSSPGIILAATLGSSFLDSLFMPSPYSLSLSLSLCLSPCIFRLLSLPLSLPIVEGVHGL